MPKSAETQRGERNVLCSQVLACTCAGWRTIDKSGSDRMCLHGGAVMINSALFHLPAGNPLSAALRIAPEPVAVEQEA
eukprot:9915602-Karenia_brevis.AAC.1